MSAAARFAEDTILRDCQLVMETVIAAIEADDGPDLRAMTPEEQKTRLDFIRDSCVDAVIECFSEKVSLSCDDPLRNKHHLDMAIMKAISSRIPKRHLVRTALQYYAIHHAEEFLEVRPFLADPLVVQRLTEDFLFKDLKLEGAFHKKLIQTDAWDKLMKQFSDIIEEKEKIADEIRHQRKVIERLENRSETLQKSTFGRVVVSVQTINVDEDDDDEDDDIEIVKEELVQLSAKRPKLDEGSIMTNGVHSSIHQSSSAPTIVSVASASTSTVPTAASSTLTRCTVQSASTIPTTAKPVLTAPVILQQQQPPPRDWRFVKPKELTTDIVEAKVNQKVFARRNSEYWEEAIVTEVVEDESRRFRVKFIKSPQILKIVNSSNIALYESGADFKQNYPVGTRVVSSYKDYSKEIFYYSGIVAEPPSDRNSYRYLLFFDDGYTQYAEPTDIRRIFLQTTENWKEISLNSQEFIKSYLEKFPDRPMVRMRPNQLIRTERSDRWHDAVVEQVDASLVLMRFPSVNNTKEWIYRGSTRLETLYKEMKCQAQISTMAINNSKILSRAPRRHTGPRIRPNDPIVEYESAKTASTNRSRAIARKSTISRITNVSIDTDDDEENMSDDSYADLCDDEAYKGDFVPTMDGAKLSPLKGFRPHCVCNSNCCKIPEGGLDELKNTNPLEIPIHLGWKRMVSRTRDKGRTRKKDVIEYCTPCGRRLRNYNDLDLFLEQTGCELGLIYFNFDFSVRINREFRAAKVRRALADISYGKERIPVPCVNSLDSTELVFIDYSPYRLPSNGLQLLEDPGFLVCCDCTDGCRDKSKCACQRLTIESTKVSRDGKYDMRAGYTHNRLLRTVITGVYECNENCKCKINCRNRVVQQGLSNKVHIFKTERKGWGMRALHDIPKGTFLCIYAGLMYGDHLSVTYASNFGDEYQADIDFIETLEEHKSGYESDVVSDLESEGSSDSLSKLRAEFYDSDTKSDKSGTNVDAPLGLLVPSGLSEAQKAAASSTKRSGRSCEEEKDKDFAPHFKKSTSIATSLRLAGAGNSGKVGDGNGGRGMRRSSSAKALQSLNTQLSTVSEDGEKPGLRSFFGEDTPYIMDAKKQGNLGRYLNHSCSPNVFVQNVFISTHDPRFPEIAFFTERRIQAGEELCWDYRYQVNSVPNKVLYCFCGAAECRGRLL